MQRLIAITLVLGFIVLMSSGCTTASPIFGTLYTSVKAPVAVGDTTAKDVKRGTATATGIMGVVIGDCSLSTAMKSQGITKVNRVETEVMSILAAYTKYTTVVYGE